MDRLNLYYLCYYKRILLQSHNVLNKKLYKAAFDYIDVQISVNDLVVEDDIKIFKILENLENLTGQKPIILKKKYRFVGSVKKFIFSSKVTLRHKNMYSFLDYCINIVFPLYERRFGFLIYVESKDSVKIAIRDYNLFFNFKSELVDNVILAFYKNKNKETDYLLSRLLKLPYKKV